MRRRRRRSARDCVTRQRSREMPVRAAGKRRASARSTSVTAIAGGYARLIECFGSTASCRMRRRRRRSTRDCVTRQRSREMPVCAAGKRRARARSASVPAIAGGCAFLIECFGSTASCSMWRRRRCSARDWCVARLVSCVAGSGAVTTVAAAGGSTRPAVLARAAVAAGRVVTGGGPGPAIFAGAASWRRRHRRVRAWITRIVAIARALAAVTVLGAGRRLARLGREHEEAQREDAAGPRARGGPARGRATTEAASRGCSDRACASEDSRRCWPQLSFTARVLATPGSAAARAAGCSAAAPGAPGGREGEPVGEAGRRGRSATLRLGRALRRGAGCARRAALQAAPRLLLGCKTHRRESSRAHRPPRLRSRETAAERPAGSPALRSSGSSRGGSGSSAGSCTCPLPNPLTCLLPIFDLFSLTTSRRSVARRRQPRAACSRYPRSNSRRRSVQRTSPPPPPPPRPRAGASPLPETRRARAKAPDVDLSCSATRVPARLSRRRSGGRRAAASGSGAARPAGGLWLRRSPRRAAPRLGARALTRRGFLVCLSSSFHQAGR